jgi:O-antigen/teichoic acid export membrane protein
MSSLSNFIVSLALARGGSAEELGAYTLMFSAYVFNLALVRSLIGEPLLALPVEPDQRTDRHEIAALGAAIALSGSMTVLIVIIGAITRRSEFLVLAVGFVPLAVQDIYRYSAFRRQSAFRAAVMDTCWVVVCAASWVQLTTGSAVRATGYWVLGGTVALVVGLFMRHWWPSGWRASYDWWKREARSLGGPLAISRVGAAGGRQLALILIAGVLGEAALGGLRAGELLVAPIMLGLIALNYVLVPPLAPRARRLRRMHAAAISAATLLGASIVAAIIWLAQDWIYGTVFADGVRPSSIIIAAVLVKLLVEASNTGYTITLKAQRRGHPIVLANSAGVIVMLPLVIVAAYRFGIDAAAWSLVSQPVVALVVLTLAFGSPDGHSTLSLPKAKEATQRKQRMLQRHR